MIKPFGTSLPKRYEKLEMVGSGGYGKVYKAKDLDSKGDIVAIKKIKLDVQSEGIPSTTMREICLLRKLSHPNIIQLKDILIEEEEISLIFDYADTDLRKELSHKGNFSEMQIKYYMKQLLLGVQFLHGHRVIHRDLKPGNLLLKGGLVKIADFGLSRYFNIPVHAYTNEVVTVWYRAPELLLGFKEYCTAIDMWSVGCIFGELYKTEPLFTGDSEIGQIFQIFQYSVYLDCLGLRMRQCGRT
jgi:serine/threonine protein kinase